MGTIMKDYTEEFNRIGRYLLIEKTSLARADAALVFGNKEICRSLANETANHFHMGYYPYIVISGGVICEPDIGDNGFAITEADRIKNYLLARGVPDKRILTEQDATNTQENVLNCKALFNERAELKDASSIISIGNIKASRRFLMTLKANWPEMFAMQIGVNGFGHPASSWYMDNRFRASVLDQYSRIDQYIKNGWIEEVDISAINEKAELLARDLK